MSALAATHDTRDGQIAQMTAVTLREALTEAFGEHVRFAVTAASATPTRTGWFDVIWIDGPTWRQVKPVLEQSILAHIMDEDEFCCRGLCNQRGYSPAALSWAERNIPTGFAATIEARYRFAGRDLPIWEFLATTDLTGVNLR